MTRILLFALSVLLLAAGNAEAACPTQGTGTAALTSNAVSACTDDSRITRYELEVTSAASATARKVDATPGALGTPKTVDLGTALEVCGSGSVRGRSCSGTAASTCGPWGTPLAATFRDCIPLPPPVLSVPVP